MKNQLLPKALIATLSAAILAGSGLLTTTAAHAETFGSGDNQFTIDFTTIGNPGNAADPSTAGGAKADTYGSVGYGYQIGTYLISQNQVDRAVASGLVGVTAGPWSGDLPAANMTWYESGAFVNWLNTSQGFQQAYNLAWSGSTWSIAQWTASDVGYDPSNPYRNRLAKFVLPTEDEYYKAAYGLSDGSGYTLYAVASNTAPIAVASGTAAGTVVYNQSSEQGPASVYQAGGSSSYGTVGQSGNVLEWTEGYYEPLGPSAKLLMGNTWTSDNNGFGSLASYARNSTGAGNEYPYLGFRVASVADVGVAPEPSTYALFGIGAIGMLMAMRRKKTA